MYLKTEPKKKSYWPLLWLTLCLIVAGCAGKYEWRPYSHFPDSQTETWLRVCGSPGANLNAMCTRKIPGYAYKWINGMRDQQYLIYDRYDK